MKSQTLYMDDAVLRMKKEDSLSEYAQQLNRLCDKHAQVSWATMSPSSIAKALQKAQRHHYTRMKQDRSQVPLATYCHECGGYIRDDIDTSFRVGWLLAYREGRSSAYKDTLFIIAFVVIMCFLVSALV